jgi:hypothetical protein
MTTRLKLYNNALKICGERSLATLTENREPRRLLDEIWDDGGVKTCLEGGQWKFAMRAIRIDYDPSITPDFGYNRAFQKPTDWCCTSSVSIDEYFKTPYLNYTDEAGYWYSDVDFLYIKYVSDDPAWGGDLSTWTERFSNYVASYFANQIVFKLTSDKERIQLVKMELKETEREAKNHDAMAEPVKFPPEGGWNGARRGGRFRNDRGNRGSLIG